jgi:ELWxxDGT repeat protein
MIKKILLIYISFITLISSSVHHSLVYTASLVKDIAINGSSSPWYLTSSDGILYFLAIDGVSGSELWRSDGTENGTYMVQDYLPGTSFGRNPSYITKIGSHIYFSGFSWSTGNELWITDGTDSGTYTIDVNPGEASSYPRYFTKAGEIIFFNACDYRYCELWKTDGTANGTTLVKDINQSSSWSNSNPTNLVTLGNNIIFLANDGTYNGLWKSDGTSIGTIELSNMTFSSPANITVAGNKAFFSYYKTENGRELGYTDGTIAGTVLLDLCPGTCSSTPDSMVSYNGWLYFVASDGESSSFYRSDGTISGTIKLDFTLGRLLVSGGYLYIAVTEYINESEGYVYLYRCDADFLNTSFVFRTDLYNLLNGFKIVGSENLVYLYYYDQGGVMWVTNGMPDGSIKAYGFNNNAVFNVNNLTPVGDKLFFIGRDNIHFDEIWSLNGPYGIFLPSTKK